MFVGWTRLSSTVWEERTISVHESTNIPKVRQASISRSVIILEGSLSCTYYTFLVTSHWQKFLTNC